MSIKGGPEVFLDESQEIGNRKGPFVESAAKRVDRGFTIDAFFIALRSIAKVER